MLSQYLARKLYLGLSLIVAGCSLSLNVLANETKSSPFNIHGFISQGIIGVDGSNFVDQDDDVTPKLTEIGINGSYVLNENVRFAGQIEYLNGGNRYSEGIVLDYLLMELSYNHSVDWQSKLYLGRFKNYHWLYSGTRDVPMLRPSIVLPQSVYFDATREMSVGGDGVALKSLYTNDEVGEIDFNISTGKASLSSEQTEKMLSKFAKGDLDHEEDLQVSVYWRPPFSNWRFGVATTQADFKYKKGKNARVITDGDLKLSRWYVNAEYEGEFWNISVELLEESMDVEGLLTQNFTNEATGHGAYLQTLYQITPKWRLLGRYEHFYANKDDKTGTKLEASTGGLVPKYFGYQHDTVIGAHYKFAENMELRFEHHWYKGTARLTPLVIPDPLTNKNEYWQLWAVQMSYWY